MTLPRRVRDAAQRMDKRKRAFSLFFIPIIPLRSVYEAACTACAAVSRIDRGEADRLLSGAR